VVLSKGELSPALAIFVNKGLHPPQRTLGRWMHFVPLVVYRVRY
jgi:hypothetical protein